MFTGLVQATGKLTAREQGDGGARLTLAVTWPAAEEATAIGDSVAVNGACLTVIARVAVGAAEHLSFELSHETLARTTLSTVAVGAVCNLERALRAGDRLGGHIVTGHVDGLAQLTEKRAHAGGWDLRYALPLAQAPEVVEKGSICIDGVSLTVNRVGGGAWPDHWIGVTIIPHTAAHTQLLAGEVGKWVHVETDILAKHVRRLLRYAEKP